MDKALLYCMQIITIFVTNYSLIGMIYCSTIINKTVTNFFFLFKTVKCGNGQA